MKSQGNRDEKMTQVLTIIAGQNTELDEQTIKALPAADRSKVLEHGRAVELFFENGAYISDAFPELRATLDAKRIDAVLQTPAGRQKKLLCADMDSTLIRQEGLDLIAAHLGLGAETAAVTERAMRGEIDFATSLTERVALLQGLAADKLEETFAALTDTPGAQTLVKTMRAHGARCVLISGGFTVFADRIAERLGCHAAHSNRLDIQDGVLTGRVLPPILDSARKREILETERQTHKFARKDVIAVGDGANDIPMLQAAATGIAFRAKPRVEDSVQHRIRHSDLTALLYLQGYTSEDILI